VCKIFLVARTSVRRRGYFNPLMMLLLLLPSLMWHYLNYCY
jgi:hypothetical protein